MFNLNDRSKDYKQRWKEHLERMLDSRLAKAVGYRSVSQKAMAEAKAQQAASSLHCDMRMKKRKYVILIPFEIQTEQ